MSSLHASTTRLLAFVLTAGIAANGEAQSPAAPSIDLPPQALTLTDLSAFRTPSANWKVVGVATSASERSAQLASSPGVGVLVNEPTSNARAAAVTSWEHGDIDVSFDVMLAQKSQPTLLLMGRYGVQLADSWVAGAPTLATIGTVAPRWDDAREPAREGFQGTLPRLNAGRASGLWQHVDIVFRAPKFEAGQKVANARFAKVSVNGVVVQENVQVPGPTRGSAFRDERASGPLVIEGDRGALAMRNIRYKAYSGSTALTGLRYRVYEGDSMDASYASTHAPTREGKATVVVGDIAMAQDKFAVAYDGTINAPTAGKYRFSLSLGWIGGDSSTRGPAVGGGTLSIDGKPVIVHTGMERRSQGDVELAAGQHAFAVSYYKNRPSFNRRDATITVEGPGLERQTLTEDSGGGGGAPVNPIIVEADAEPVVLRSFVRHGGTKRVIAVSIADPRGVHYSYDLAQGAMLYLWRGPFLETTQMWHERGEDQTAEPLGSVVTLPGAPSVAHLANAAAAWPDSLDERELRRNGYALDKSGHPTFLYDVHSNAVEDAVSVDADGLSLHRELRLHQAKSPGLSEGMYVQIARADHITRQRDGSYVVGDRSYYVRLRDTGLRSILRRSNGIDELLVPVQFTRGEGSVAYSIVW